MKEKRRFDIGAFLYIKFKTALNKASASKVLLSFFDSSTPRAFACLSSQAY